MKSLFTIFLLSALSFSGIAQMVQHAGAFKDFEAGINYGGSIITLPRETTAKGSKADIQSTFTAHALYNFTENWQGGLTYGVSTWKTTGSETFNYTLGRTFTHNITYKFGDPAMHIGVMANYNIPFYASVRDFNYANFFFGLSAGAVFTAMDGRNLVNNQYNLDSSNNFVYTTEYHYNYGRGYFIGLQVGYTYYVSDHIGFSAEFNPRFNQVFTLDMRYGHTNDRYTLFELPATIGIHYRWSYNTGKNLL